MKNKNQITGYFLKEFSKHEDSKKLRASSLTVVNSKPINNSIFYFGFP
jgi:hypothetical protein